LPRHHGQAKNGNCRIEGVRGCNPEPGDDAVQPAVRNRPPDTEQGDGTHRYGKSETDDESLDERAEFHDDTVSCFLSFWYGGMAIMAGGVTLVKVASQENGRA